MLKRMPPLYYLTSNKGKIQETKGVLQPHRIRVIPVKVELYEEGKDRSEVIRNKARSVMDKTGYRNFILDDTSIYFDAFDCFPATNAKSVFNNLGYKDIFRLLEGKSRGASITTTVAFCEADSKLNYFVGECMGRISDAPSKTSIPGMPFYSIFMPERSGEIMADMPLSERMRYSARCKALQKLLQYLKGEKWIYDR